MSRTTTVYLLHFTPHYTAAIAGTSRVKTAGHYLGSTAAAATARLEEHVRGAGSPLVRAAVQAGCRVELVRTWDGGRDLERELKRSHHHARLCPLCRSSA